MKWRVFVSSCPYDYKITTPYFIMNYQAEFWQGSYIYFPVIHEKPKSGSIAYIVYEIPNAEKITEPWIFPIESRLK